MIHEVLATSQENISFNSRIEITNRNASRLYLLNTQSRCNKMKQARF
ncbi:hypothetical protein C7S14_4303 [Burkholderia cepacia]|nr:hypothetical protein C7S14_4303 [Burkholderia cepacia]